MKKIVIPIVVIFISGLIIINYLSFKSPKTDKLISQNKIYSLYDINEISINLYANRKTAYQNIDAINNCYISDIENNKKLKIDLITINKTEQYDYLNETYTSYNYLFSLPNIDNYFYIEEAYLTITLQTADKITIKIGSFDYYVENSNLKINELSGTRYEDFPSLNKIVLAFDLEEPIYISKVYFNNKIYNNVNKIVNKDEVLEIELSKQLFKIDIISLKLTYYIDDQQYEYILPYYLYYQTNENPLLYGSLNNVTIIS